MEAVDISQIEQTIEKAAVNEVKPSAIKAFFDTLPEKAIGLSIRVVITLIFLVLAFFAIRIIRKLVKKGLNKAGIEKSVISFTDSLLKIALWVVVIFSVAVNYGVDAASIVALLGSAGLTIGLAMQGALSNLAGGMLILITKPFKVGDYIIENSGKCEGTVSGISVFYTHLITIDNKMVVIPNGVLANSSLTNATTFGNRLIDLEVTISYESDLKKAKSIADRTIRGNEHVIKDMPIKVFVKELGSSGVVLGLRASVKTDEYWDGVFSINEQIKLAYDEEKIEIPYDQMDIHIKEN